MFDLMFWKLKGNIFFLSFYLVVAYIHDHVLFFLFVLDSIRDGSDPCTYFNRPSGLSSPLFSLYID